MEIVPFLVHKQTNNLLLILLAMVGSGSARYSKKPYPLHCIISKHPTVTPSKLHGLRFFETYGRQEYQQKY
jgi:hypothetical protein